MNSGSELGDFLRARRDRTRPGDVGLEPDGRRRVPGLRRDEVAHLAGISCEYYLRLERGRDLHPSAQVLDALARVLGLEAEATAYLHGLARPGRRRGRRPRRERVPEGIRQFVEGRTDLPAMVMDRYQNVLLSNPLATSLNGRPAGGNALRDSFLDPSLGARYLEDEWQGITAGLVAAVRALAGPESEDPYLAGLVGELSVRSEEFRRLWARHEVRPRTGGVATVLHPQVGPMRLNYEKLAVTGTEGLVLVFFHAAPGSEAEERLALLSHLVHDADTPVAGRADVCEGTSGDVAHGTRTGGQR